MNVQKPASKSPGTFYLEEGYSLSIIAEGVSSVSGEKWLSVHPCKMDSLEAYNLNCYICASESYLKLIAASSIFKERWPLKWLKISLV